MLSNINKLLLCCLIGAMASCAQDSIELIDPVPSQFTQKAFLEMYNGAWCGFSPDGDLFAQRIKEEVGADVFDFYEIHVGGSAGVYADAMTISDLQHMNQRFANGYPSGVINWSSQRAEYRNVWQQRVEDILSSKASCGLSIDAKEISNGIAKIKVKLAIGPTDLPESDYYLACYLYEKEMSGEGPGWDQVNYYSKERGSGGVNIPEHEYYNSPDPIVGYKHPNVALARLHDIEYGDPIKWELLKGGTSHLTEYEVDITGYGDDLRVVAYLFKDESHPGTAGIMEMCNVQFVDIGEHQPFD